MKKRPHTAAVLKAAPAQRKGLGAIIDEAQAAIEKHAFMVRRTEYLLQQSVMLRATAEEISRDAAVFKQFVANLNDKLDKAIEIRDARPNKRAAFRRRPRAAKRHRGRSR